MHKYQCSCWQVGVCATSVTADVYISLLLQLLHALPPKTTVHFVFVSLINKLMVISHLSAGPGKLCGSYSCRNSRP